MGKKRISFFVFNSIIGGCCLMLLRRKKKIKELQDNNYKMQEFYRILVSWLSIRQMNHSLVKYFQQKGYQKIAIYGMKELGERLYEELQGSNILVQYAIDQNADEIYAKCEVKNPEDELNDIDIIVVTAVHFYDEIANKLREKVDCPIVSIVDIILETERNYISDY